MRVCAVKGTKFACGISWSSRPRNAEFFLGQNDNAAALGRFIGQGRELGRPGQLLLGYTRGRE